MIESVDERYVEESDRKERENLIWASRGCIPDLGMDSSAVDAAGSGQPWLAACGLLPPLNKVWLRALLVGHALISFHVFLFSCLISHYHIVLPTYGSDLLNN